MAKRHDRYVLAAFVAFFVSRIVDVDMRALLRHRESLIAVAIALPFISFGLLGIYTGRISTEDGTYSRRKNPLVYWLLVGLSLSLGIVAMLFGLAAMWK